MTIISLLFLILRTKHGLKLDLNVHVWLTVKSSQCLIIIFLFCNKKNFVAGIIVIVRAINKNWSEIKRICSEIILTELYMWTCLLDWFWPKTQNLKCALPPTRHELDCSVLGQLCTRLTLIIRAKVFGPSNWACGCGPRRVHWCQCNLSRHGCPYKAWWGCKCHWIYLLQNMQLCMLCYSQNECSILKYTGMPSRTNSIQNERLYM